MKDWRKRQRLGYVPIRNLRTRITEFREKYGLNYQEFAALCGGVSSEYLRNLGSRSGRNIKTMRQAEMASIEKLLNLSETEVYEAVATRLKYKTRGQGPILSITTEELEFLLSTSKNAGDILKMETIEDLLNGRRRVNSRTTV